MKINRRKFMAFAGVSAAVLGMPNWSYAQSKIVFDSVNVFVPAAPGGGWDGLARSIEVASKSALFFWKNIFKLNIYLSIESKL